MDGEKEGILTLSGDTSEVIRALREGRVNLGSEVREAFLRERICLNSSLCPPLFIFKTQRALPSCFFSRVRFFYKLFLLIQKRFPFSLLVASAYTFFYGLEKGWSFDALIGGAAGLGVFCLQFAGFCFHEVRQHLNLLKKTSFFSSAQPSLFSESGRWNARELEKTAFAFLILGVLFGIPVLIQAPLALLLGLFAGMGVLLEQRGISSLWVFFFLHGPCLVLGLSLALFNRFSGELFYGSCFLGLFSLMPLSLNRLENLKRQSSERWLEFSWTRKHLVWLLGLHLAFFLSLFFFSGFSLKALSSQQVLGCFLGLGGLAFLGFQFRFLYLASGVFSPRVFSLNKLGTLYSLVMALAFFLVWVSFS